MAKMTFTLSLLEMQLKVTCMAAHSWVGASVGRQGQLPPQKNSNYIFLYCSLSIYGLYSPNYLVEMRRKT